MKKTLGLVICILLAGSLILTGCSEDNDVQSTQDSSMVSENHKQEEAQSQEDKESELASAENNFSMDMDCGICHTEQAQVMDNPNSISGNHSSTQCVACHDDSEKLSEAHDGADPAKADKVRRLKVTTVNSEKCFKCHPRDELVAKTSDSNLLTDKNGTTVNPHDWPDTPGHSDIDCSSCHIMHAEADDTLERAPQFCVSCHHDGVYECGTCHE